MVWMNAQDSMMLRKRKHSPNGARVSLRVANSSQTNAAAKLTTVVVMVRSRMRRAPSS